MVTVEFISKHHDAEFAAQMNMRNADYRVINLTIESGDTKSTHEITVNEALNLVGNLEDILDEIKAAEFVLKAACGGVNA
jgi:hypothetical protein